MLYLKKKGLPFKFHGAKDVTDCKTSEEVMIKAGLDWPVGKCEIYAKPPVEEVDITNLATDGFYHDGDLFTQVPNGYATYRMDNGYPLGIVKERYTPVQNVDAFKFFDDAIGKNAAIWQTAGLFGGGQRIFVSAKLPDTISVKGDTVDSYLVFTNSHDGSTGVKILFTPIRVVCENTLNAAIRTSQSYVTFKHTKSVHDNISTAKEILGICQVISGKLQETYNFMRSIKVDDRKAKEIIAKTVLTQSDFDKLKQGGYTHESIFAGNYNAVSFADISTQKYKMMLNMNLYYHEGIGQKEIEGTAWGVYNAITGYYSNMENNEGIKRMDTLLYGDRSRKIETVGNLILAEAV